MNKVKENEGLFEAELSLENQEATAPMSAKDFAAWKRQMEMVFLRMTVATEVNYLVMSMRHHNAAAIIHNLVEAFDRDDSWWYGSRGWTLAQYISYFDHPIRRYESDDRLSPSAGNYNLPSAMAMTRGLM